MVGEKKDTQDTDYTHTEIHVYLLVDLSHFTSLPFPSCSHSNT